MRDESFAARRPKTLHQMNNRTLRRPCVPTTVVTPSSIQNGRGCKDWRLLTGIYIVWSSSFVFRQSASEKKQAHQIPLTPVPGLLPPLYPLDLASRLF
ncbi:hypothetical protein MJO28_003125 [Puccinia striiformis f. sp. tritici]|uniref:Uncharacterized protein n=1 Tax=Puccinia striiformis f. sp. tritici TaxID=168172 RepID=A0ACC0ESM4_9BASI|nr:hypothetical protein MJO28_003125 [Puccinia striiformis f. sp. tritici]